MKNPFTLDRIVILLALIVGSYLGYTTAEGAVKGSPLTSLKDNIVYERVSISKKHMLLKNTETDQIQYYDLSSQVLTLEAFKTGQLDDEITIITDTNSQMPATFIAMKFTGGYLLLRR